MRRVGKLVGFLTLKQKEQVAIIVVDGENCNIKFNSSSFLSAAPTTAPDSVKSVNASKKMSHVPARSRKIIENTQSLLLRQPQRTIERGGVDKR
jgi:hypothetical protein